MSLFMPSKHNSSKGGISNEDTNPCTKEHALSLQCLDANGYDRDACLDFFENYRVCKAFWLFVYKERKRKGISPYLPIPGERDAAKKEYMPYFKY